MTRRRDGLKDVRRGLKRKEKEGKKNHLGGNLARSAKFSGGNFPPIPPLKCFFLSFLFSVPLQDPAHGGNDNPPPRPAGVCGGLEPPRVVVVVVRNSEILLTRSVRDNNG